MSNRIDLAVINFIEVFFSLNKINLSNFSTLDCEWRSSYFISMSIAIQDYVSSISSEGTPMGLTLEFLGSGSEITVYADYWYDLNNYLSEYNILIAMIILLSYTLYVRIIVLKLKVS